ncbi:hypothetical protein AB6A40_010476 [Gnathostoma spinigerum]|uniref:Uncharacterized protein n=1 Tax=Gnathostoma spinigerum TaxID=75299 RepID=A0ABD6F2T5_9BILA
MALNLSSLTPLRQSTSKANALAAHMMGLQDDSKGISARSGIEYCHLVGFNILYDITNFNDLIGFAPVGCTSIVVENSEHRIIHGRNLDYFMTDLMKNLSIMVDFVRKDQVLYSGLTFAFFAGLTTGQKPNAFTISLNARRTGWYIYTLLMEVYTLFRNPIGLEIRSVGLNCFLFTLWR